MSTNNYLVYMHTSKTSSKSYIGITNNLVMRIARHKAPSNKCIAFAHAIAKYGWDDFVTTILHTNLSLDQANSMEANCIVEFNTLSPNGYNLKAGGDVGVLSNETKERISESKRGKQHTDETKQKISEKMKGNKNSRNKPSKPRSPMSDEHKQHMSESRKGQPRATMLATCPHCGKTGNNAAMHRHHFDNCKLR